MKNNNPKRYFLAIAIVLLFSACAHRIEATRPDVALPLAWTSATSGNMVLQKDWWRGFGSEELSALIEEAQRGSPTLKIAAERVVQAEIAARSAGASLFPLLTVRADTGTGRVRPSGTVSGWSKTESSGASLQVNYEVDVWGRVAATATSANASLAASRHDLETVRTTLTAGVANAYFQTLALRTRIKIAEQNLAIAEKLFAIVQARYRYGSANALDVSRQRSTVLAQRAAILPLQTQERQTVNALAILLGRTPQSLQLAAIGLDGLNVPEVSPDLPATLITRRPDIASAEANLYAADANVAAARAALLPTVSLNGAATAAGSALFNLDSPTYTVGLAASFVQTLFNGNRLRQQVQSTQSAQRQLVESYRNTIHTALKEVEDALGNVARDRAQERSRSEILTESQRALRLSELRYREGADDLGSLLDAQRTLFSAEDAFVQQRLSRLNSATDLFKALGGGWERDREKAREGMVVATGKAP